MEAQNNAFDVLAIAGYMKDVDINQLHYLVMNYNWVGPKHFTHDGLTTIVKCLKDLEEFYDDGRVPKAFDFERIYQTAGLMMFNLAE